MKKYPIEQGEDPAQQKRLDFASLSNKETQVKRLEFSEEQLSFALDAARMVFWDWNLQTGKASWSSNFVHLYGLDVDSQEKSYEAFLSTVHPEDRQLIEQDAQKSLQSKRDSSVEYRIILPDGKIRWIRSQYKFFYDEQGNPVKKTGIDIDITERKLAEIKIKDGLKEKEVLLQEIHHRVKNNLQVVSSLLDLQSMHIDSPALLEVFRDFQNRVKAMAIVHQQLYESNNLSQINLAVYIRSLTENLFQVYSIVPAKVSLILDLDNVSLKIDAAISCGLIINELINNAIKHAFNESTQGVIKLSLTKDESKNITLIVGDNGIGLPENWELPNSHPLEFQLVNALVQQLEGTIEYNCYCGTKFCIRIPCD
ncbi:MAG: PAS domain-containing protein [Symploca sp. SIO3C6]|nr:PAS domain-containing protein [Symploca sp. SIO3C6]